MRLRARQRPLGSREGMALVLTLMVLAIITALVVEFAYGVYVNTTLLYNWQAAQKLSMLANSGASLAAQYVTGLIGQKSYTYPGSVALPPQDPLEDGNFVSLLIEDENSKFNLNTLVQQNGEYNIGAYEGFRVLLEELSLEEKVADLLVDWIDRDTVPMSEGGERGGRNAPLQSVEELLLIPGIDREVYDKLLPYVTIYGANALGKAMININGASVPVLMTLSGVSRDMAQSIVDYRESTPFKKINTLFNDVQGFENMNLGENALTEKITVKGSAFRLEINASLEDGLSTVINCVMDTAGVVKYWKET